MCRMCLCVLSQRRNQGLARVVNPVIQIVAQIPERRRIATHERGAWGRRRGRRRGRGQRSSISSRSTSRAFRHAFCTKRGRGLHGRQVCGRVHRVTRCSGFKKSPSVQRYAQEFRSQSPARPPWFPLRRRASPPQERRRNPPHTHPHRGLLELQEFAQQ
jgi:hypothetical protein